MIRPATPADWPGIWDILEPVFRAGTTYAIARDITEHAARDYWLHTPAACYVYADADAGSVLGTFYIRTNAQGGGAHVCNCGYVTADAARGRGIAETMCRFSQTAAAGLGYKAMQFNMVLASNTGAVRLWDRLGYDTVGRLPKVFNHPDIGFVDGLVMYKWLNDAS